MWSAVSDNLKDGADVVKQVFATLARDKACLAVAVIFSILYLPQALILIHDNGLILAYETDSGSHIDAVRTVLNTYDMNEAYHSRYYGWTFFALCFVILTPIHFVMALLHNSDETYLILGVRLILFCLGLLSTLLFYALLRELFRGRLLAFFGALLYIASPVCYQYFFLIHPETTGLSLVFMATIYLLRYSKIPLESPDKGYFYPALVCMILASYSKQIYFFLSLPILYAFFHLVSERKRLSYVSLIFSVSFARALLVSAALALALLSIIHPHLFFQFDAFLEAQADLATTMNGPYTKTMTGALIIWSEITSSIPLLLLGFGVLPLVLVASVISYAKSRSRESFLLAVNCGAIVLITTLTTTMNRLMFNPHYFHPVYPLVIILVLACVEWMDRIVRGKWKIPAEAAAYLWLAIILAVSLYQVLPRLIERLDYKELIAYRTYDYILSNMNGADRIAYDHFVGMPDSFAHNSCHYWQGCGTDYIDSFAPNYVMFNGRFTLWGDEMDETKRLKKYVAEHGLKLVTEITGSHDPGTVPLGEPRTVTVSVFRK